MANDIQIANGRVVQVGADRFIEFDLSWENSWRVADLGHGVGNWDAAWVFVKYRVQVASGGDDLWKHVWLNTANGDHVPGAGTGATINIGTTNITGTDRGMGAFIYRSGNGTGPFSTTGIRLRWDFAGQVLATTPLEIRIFAIEMVYVAEGAFYVGSGGTEFASFTQANNTSGASVPFQIISTPPTIQGNDASSSSSNLGARDAMAAMDITGTTTASLASGFPTGYAAFYCMKNEISQQQYVDFLNTLTGTQGMNRVAPQSPVGKFRNGISVDGAVYSSTLPFVANNFMHPMDGMAYMDWSGLRPMTELEYEKAARGFAPPVPNEFAWGSTSITNETGISNAGASNETAANDGANVRYDIFPLESEGPLRVGAFAKVGTTREQAGASYWGILDLSSNLFEKTVTVGNATGRGFTGLHGDGTLSTLGHANVTAWPGLSSGEVTTATGTGFRAHAWHWASGYPLVLTMSYRGQANLAGPNRNSTDGFRGVRSAP